MSGYLQRAAIRGYVLLSATGIWRTRLGERVFLLAFFAYKRCVEDPFAALAERHPSIFRGGDIIDVGANAGYTASVFARMLSAGHRVLAVEPEPTNIRRLNETILRRGLSKTVTVIPVAAGEAAGEAKLRINPIHPGDHAVTLQDGGAGLLDVPMVRIDDIAKDATVAFVKIDVQGYELQVSRGMTELLARSPRITVAIEFSPDSCLRAGYQPDDLLRFYTDRGFTIRRITRRGNLVPFESDTTRVILRTRTYVDLLCTR